LMIGNQQSYQNWIEEQRIASGSFGFPSS